MNKNFINISSTSLSNGSYNVKSFIANKTWNFSSDDVKNFPNETQETVDVVWSTANFNFIDVIKAWIESLGTTSITVIPSSNISNTNGNSINVFRFFYPENDKYFGNIINLYSSLYSNDYTYQPLDPKLFWYYLDHNFYKDYYIDKSPSHTTDFDTNNNLSPTGSAILFPRNMFGEGFKKGTFKLTNYNPVNTDLEYVIADDGIGNLIDETLDQTKIIDHKSNMLYVGFNEKYREYNFLNKRLAYVLDWSGHLNNVNIINEKQISYSPGIPTNDTMESSGVCANFNGAYLNVKNSELFNFNKNMDYAFSFWINVPPTQSVQDYDYNPLFDKKTIKLNDFYTSKTGIYSVDSEHKSYQYPFDITLTNSNSPTPYVIKFSQSDGVVSSSVSSNELTTDSWNHVVCQKSGSIYQVWLNGTLNSSEEIYILNNIQNNHNFYIAGDGTDKNYFSGSLDEIRIYDKSLSSDEINNLYDNTLKNGYAYQTSKIGNIFYEYGIGVISDPRPKYSNALLGRNGIFDYENLEFGFEGTLKTTSTLYENEIVCKLEKNKFNFTQNPSALTKYNGKTNLKSFVTDSTFTPYITSIGLYNDNNDLVAIAKFATPLKKRKDIDINVIIRFDM